MGRSELSLGIQSQMLTVPMQSVRLGGGALGFAFPKNRFISAGGEETQTLEENQKRKRSRSGFSFRPHPHPRRKRRVLTGVFQSFFRVFSSSFQRRSVELWERRKDFWGRGLWEGWGGASAKWVWLRRSWADRAGPGAGSVPRAWRADGVGPVSSRAGLQGCAVDGHRWAVNKRGPGGSQQPSETARGPGAAGTPAARPSARPGAAPVGAPGRARLASLSAFICPQCSQRV